MSSPERSLLVINYRSASLTRQAIASARDASSVPLQVVVVDNSCDQEEMERLQSAGADEVIRAPRNLGYAGGINFGLPRCEADAVVISNPDVLFFADSIDLLAEQFRSDVGVVGPSFVWDDAGQWMLPPPEDPRLMGKLSEILSIRSNWWHRWRHQRRLRERTHFWSLSRPTDLKVVSGAVMYTSRKLLREVGGFDEQFSLYFEEIDLMRRIRGMGRKVRYVPRAVCRHLYNQSAGMVDDSHVRYASSEALYFRKWSGRLAVHFMRWLGPSHSFHELSFRPVQEPAVTIASNDLDRFVVEASPLSNFESAAGHFPHTKRVSIPHEVWRSYRNGQLYMRVVDRRTGRVMETVSIRKTD